METKPEKELILEMMSEEQKNRLGNTEQDVLDAIEGRIQSANETEGTMYQNMVEKLKKEIKDPKKLHDEMEWARMTAMELRQQELSEMWKD